MKDLGGNPFKPYHGEIISCRKIIGDVGEAAWDHFNRALPFRGNQDQLIGILFHKFYQQLLKENIPPHYEPDNDRLIASILERITIRPIDGRGPDEPHGRTETGASEGPAGTPSLGPTPSVSSSEHGQETLRQETEGDRHLEPDLKYDRNYPRDLNSY